MFFLTTGLIENTPVAGVRPSSSFTIKITNDGTTAAIVQIDGFFVTGTTKTQYVLETFSLAAGEVATRKYFVQFDEFEFQFITSSVTVTISAWGENTSMKLTVVHRLVAKSLVKKSLPEVKAISEGEVCKPFFLSVGRFKIVTKVVAVKPPGLADVTINNKFGGGGVDVHCRQIGKGTVELTVLDLLTDKEANQTFEIKCK